MHLFEVPFYYIEYGIAQLGALAIWKNSQLNYYNAIEAYKMALTVGYSKSIPKIYADAGITFDFSLNNIASLADFVREELNKMSEE